MFWVEEQTVAAALSLLALLQAPVLFQLLRVGQDQTPTMVAALARPLAYPPADLTLSLVAAVAAKAAMIKVATYWYILLMAGHLTTTRGLAFQAHQ